MKIFTTKSLAQKIIIALVIVMLLEFVYPNLSQAATASVLLNPIMSFLTDVCDAIMHVLQKNVLGMEESFFELDSTTWWQKAGKIIAITLAGVAIAVTVVVLSVATAGLASAPVAGIASALSISGITASAVVAIPITGAIIAGVYGEYAVNNAINKKWGLKHISLPIFALSTEEIVLNKIAMLDVNFMNPNKYDNVYMRDSLGYPLAKDGRGDDIDGDGQPDGRLCMDENGNPLDKGNAITLSSLKSTDSVATKLQPTIAKWYIALRNLAIVMLLSILVYIGIRMIISSTAGEKSKYKQMLVDWVVAICLLFCMHYIMSFATSVIESLNGLFQKESNGVLVALPSTEEYQLSSSSLDDEDEEKIEAMIENMNSQDGFVWPTNLMGSVRLEMQLNNSGEKKGETYDYTQIGYTMIYLVLVIYTIMFLFIYIRRVIYMAFLTLIAPLVAMTYPLDKLHDGKAQAFNMWIKEYIFTLLIQPVHALLYTVFVSMAMEFAVENVIYTLVCIGFILQAEKIVRKFFGFEKASAFPMMNTVFTSALLMQGVNKLRGKDRGGSSGGNKGSGIRMNGATPDSRGASTHFEPVNVFEGTGSVPESVPGSAPESVPGSVPGSAPESVPGNASGDVPGSAPVGVPEGAPESVPGNASESGQEDEQENRTKREIHKGNRSLNRETIRNIKKNSSSKPGKQRIKAGVRTFGGYLKTAGKYTLASGVASIGEVPNKLIRTATRLPLSATLGAIGVAAGLASDNDANIFKYGAAGAAVGYAASGKTNNVDVSNIKENAFMDTYGDEYENYMNAQSDIAFMKDSEANSAYKKKFGDKYKERMVQALEYRKNGITDNKIIMKAMKAPGFGAENSQKRIALAQLATEISSAKDLGRLGIRLKQNGVSEEEKEEIIEAIRYIKGMHF